MRGKGPARIAGFWRMRLEINRDSASRARNGEGIVPFRLID